MNIESFRILMFWFDLILNSWMMRPYHSSRGNDALYAQIMIECFEMMIYWQNRRSTFTFFVCAVVFGIDFLPIAVGPIGARVPLHAMNIILPLKNVNKMFMYDVCMFEFLNKNNAEKKWTHVGRAKNVATTSSKHTGRGPNGQQKKDICYTAKELYGEMRLLPGTHPFVECCVMPSYENRIVCVAMYYKNINILFIRQQQQQQQKEWWSACEWTVGDRNECVHTCSAVFFSVCRIRNKKHQA